jgi:hypothetical protein
MVSSSSSMSSSSSHAAFVSDTWSHCVHHVWNRACRWCLHIMPGSVATTTCSTSYDVLVSACVSVCLPTTTFDPPDARAGLSHVPAVLLTCLPVLICNVS